MKIAISNAFLPSEQHHGVPYQVHYLANTLVDRGHEVTVFTFSPKPSDALYRLHQYPRPNVHARFFPFFMAFRLAQTDFSAFDAVHVHGDNYLLKGTQHVRTFHGSAKDELRFAVSPRRKLFFAVTMLLERIGAKVSSINVGVSEATRAAIPEVDQIIPCGVDVDGFRRMDKSRHPTILFVGTEGGRKRGSWLADVFTREVRPSIPNAELIMVTESAISEPGIVRTGRLSKDKLAELYGSAWIFCLPSTYEGFGVPFIEAMASGTAVVATANNPGAEEVLDRGRFGKLSGDDHLGETIREMLGDALVRREYERVAYLRSREFAWDAIANAYEKVYGSVSSSTAKSVYRLR